MYVTRNKRPKLRRLRAGTKLRKKNTTVKEKPSKETNKLTFKFKTRSGEEEVGEIAVGVATFHCSRCLRLEAGIRILPGWYRACTKDVRGLLKLTPWNNARALSRKLWTTFERLHCLINHFWSQCFSVQVRRHSAAGNLWRIQHSGILGR